MFLGRGKEYRVKNMEKCKYRELFFFFKIIKDNLSIYSLNPEEMNHIQEQIEQYIRGNLDVNEIDSLWIEFLRAPHLYDYFLTRLHLWALIKNKKRRKNEFVSQ